MAVQDYRQTAAKLRERAAKAKDSSVREQLLLMAADWDKLADNADQAEARLGSPARK